MTTAEEVAEEMLKTFRREYRNDRQHTKTDKLYMDTMDDNYDDYLSDLIESWGETLHFVRQAVDTWLSDATDPLTGSLLADETVNKLLELPAWRLAKAFGKNGNPYTLIDTAAMDALQDWCVRECLNIPQSFSAIKRYRDSQHHSRSEDY